MFSIAGASDLTVKEFIASRTINLQLLQREMIETTVALNDFISRESWWRRFRMNPINLRSLLFPDLLCEAHDCSFTFQK